MHLVKNHDPLPHRTKKTFRIMQPLRHARQVAVKELRVRDALRQHRLAGPARAGQPDNGRLLPGRREPFVPKRSFDHATTLYD